MLTNNEHITHYRDRTLQLTTSTGTAWSIEDIVHDMLERDDLSLEELRSLNEEHLRAILRAAGAELAGKLTKTQLINAIASNWTELVTGYEMMKEKKEQEEKEEKKKEEVKEKEKEKEAQEGLKAAFADMTDEEEEEADTLRATRRAGSTRREVKRSQRRMTQSWRWSSRQRWRWSRRQRWRWLQSPLSRRSSSAHSRARPC